MHRLLCVETFGLLALLGCSASCGPNGTDESHTCGGYSAVRILDEASLPYGVYAGDRVLAGRLTSETSADVFTAGVCGEESVPVGMLEFDLASPLIEFGVVDDHVVRFNDETGDMWWIDGAGSSPPHLLFSEVLSCVQPVEGGLVAQSDDGRVLFHPEPSSASVSPRVLLEGAISPEFGLVSAPDFAVCRWFATELPVVDGDGVLVAEDGGPLVRIALPEGEREELLAGPVGEFAVLDDPRYILWRGGSDPASDRDCCAIYVLDRQTGSSVRVGSGTLESDIRWNRQWLSERSFDWDINEPNEYRWFSLFQNYITGATFRLDGDWRFYAGLSRTELLVRDQDSSTTYIFDTEAELLQPIDFSPSPNLDASFEDGVVARGEGGEVRLLRFGSRQPEVLATGVPAEHWRRTLRGNLLFIERVHEDDLGVLVLVDGRGERRELATNVRQFVVPHEGTVRERNEVLYSVDDGSEAAGWWRLVLPER